MLREDSLKNAVFEETLEGAGGAMKISERSVRVSQADGPGRRLV